jgi:hypothetical protein
MRWLALFALVSGCSYTFDSSAPDLPLLGPVPDTDLLPHLNHTPATSGAAIIYGADHQPWAVWNEVVDGELGPVEGLRFRRLVDPPTEETLAQADANGNGPAYYWADPPSSPNPMPTTIPLHVHTVGSGAPDDEYDVPFGPPFFIPDSHNTVFVWWVLHRSTTNFLVMRRDRSFMRMLPVPDGLSGDDPTQNGQLFFNSDGKWLYTQDGNGVVVRHSTTDETDVTIGPLPATLILDDTRKILLACGMEGVLAAPIDGTPPNTLDASPCDEGSLFWDRGPTVVYQSGGVTKQVKVDGSQSAMVVLDAGERFLGFGPGDAVVYSTDPADRYVNGAGSGFIGGWQFMERGRNIQFSAKGTRVRWLEFAAKPGGVGDLDSAPINGGAGGQALHLARNVRRYDEIPDGRVIACANRAFRGIQNRVVAIDEQAQVAQWVAQEAADYVRIPGTTDLLVDVVSGPSTYDIVRVSVPPKQ